MKVAISIENIVGIGLIDYMVKPQIIPDTGDVLPEQNWAFIEQSMSKL